jgi:hypothetical protein
MAYFDAATRRILAALSADTPTLATVNTNVTALGTSTRLGSIAGIDRGTITVAPDVDPGGTATVTAVVLARAVLHHLGQSRVADGTTASDIANAAGGKLVLTNTTTITYTVGAAAPGGMTVSYQLVEYAE